jgi:hypothetical protein
MGSVYLGTPFGVCAVWREVLHCWLAVCWFAYVTTNSRSSTDISQDDYKYRFEWNVTRNCTARQGISVSIVTRLRAGRQGFDSRQEQLWDFSLRRVQTQSGAHPASYTVGTGGSFSGSKAARSVELTTHLHLVQRLRIGGAIHPLPQYVFIACA